MTTMIDAANADGGSGGDDDGGTTKPEAVLEEHPKRQGRDRTQRVKVGRGTSHFLSPSFVSW